jgi:glycosyltransferase involved in cell wall biosynthesis
MHGRPVICSDVGGMAEKVTHQVDGLLFPVQSAGALAETLRAAAETPGLWERLADGIAPVHTIEDHVAALESVYRRLLEGRAERGRIRAAVAGAH